MTVIYKNREATVLYENLSKTESYVRYWDNREEEWVGNKELQSFVTAEEYLNIVTNVN